ncbi:MAG: SDR family NAD(P)-dependent oxidoreductase [Geminicoccaceae bacterium]
MTASGLADRVVLVTGAAGNLGAAVVARLIASGSSVVAANRSADKLAVATAGLGERHLARGGVDLTDPAACRRLVDEAIDRFGRLDGLVSTVGTFAMASIEAADPAHWELLYRANVLTTLNICRAVVPVMRSAGRGGIVTIGAAGAARAGKGTAAYAAAKSAVLRLTESLADELKGHGVRANCVLPSIIDTLQNRADMPKADTGRWVTPAQLAEVIAFLLSDAASGVTGTGVPVTAKG